MGADIGIDDSSVVAELVLPRYEISERRTLKLINLSENATFIVDDLETHQRSILRVHRLGYHDRAAIESELDWTAALRADGDVATPGVVTARDGSRVQEVEVDGRERYAVLFDLAPGIEPDGSLLRPKDFETLGQITARLHQHARQWKRPPQFSRFEWNRDEMLGAAPRWGRWQDGIGVDNDAAEILSAAAELVGDRLVDYGSGRDRFGLIHADLRLANLLVVDDEITVIDFDDCGFSWFMYDFGTAVSFIEDDARLPQWRAAWLRGYRTVADLSETDEHMLATFVMLRRLMLVAWMGSHSHSAECRAVGPTYTAGSVRLAQRYLASDGASVDQIDTEE